MKIAFFSVTGRVRDFVNRLPYVSYEISPVAPPVEMDKPYVLILSTYDWDYFEAVEEFLDQPQNQVFLQGVTGSGNRNFGTDYVFIAREIAEAYGVPLICDFEHSGTEQDISTFEKEVERIADTGASRETEGSKLL